MSLIESSTHRPLLHTANLPIPERRPGTPAVTQPFVTIARQIGAGGATVPPRLAAALSSRSAGQAHWSAWDRELIEKVAADFHLPLDMVESTLRQHAWLDSFLGGLVGSPDEVTILHRVQELVRRLARGGAAVLVGHGSVFMTHDIPGGVHIWLVAPHRQRVDNLAQAQGLSAADAERRVRRLERERFRFLHRFWPAKSMTPETFAATLNTAQLDDEAMVRSILAIVPASSGSAAHFAPLP